MFQDKYAHKVDKNIFNIVHDLNNQLLVMNNIPIFRLNNFHYTRLNHSKYTYNNVLTKFVQSDELKHDLKSNGFN